MSYHYKCLLFQILLLVPCLGRAQSLPIAIDGQYDDWTGEATVLEDAVGDGSSLDLLRISVANDEKYLYIRLEVDDEVVLTDDNNLSLFIDGDNNNLTGKAVNGIGAELDLRFADLEAVFYYGNATDYVSLESVAFHHLPNFSSKVFEIAIGRDVLPDGDNPLFSGNEIRLFLRNGSNGDKLPDQGQTFTYTFDNAPTPPFQPIDLYKTNPNHVRLVTWNTLFDGLLELERRPHFKQIMGVLQPDIVTFNECWDMTAGQAATFMNEALPLGNFQSWQAARLVEGNITVSRWPISQSWEFFPDHRLCASLIDLPNAAFTKDILVINGHLRCCTADYDRQLEADAFVKFIIDTKSPGGSIDLPEGTPFVLSGDMNLVGDGQQYTTLVTGDIVNNNLFGPDGILDWDDTDLLDVLALQADQRMAYTWHESGNVYPPSRLDFHICSNSVMDVEKAFSLQTELMSAERLEAYGLEQFSTSLASDHLPKVTDFSLAAATATEIAERSSLEVSIFPNPTAGDSQISFTNPKAGRVVFFIKTIDGKTLRQWSSEQSAGRVQEQLNMAGLPAGTYQVEASTPTGTGAGVLMKVGE